MNPSIALAFETTFVNRDLILARLLRRKELRPEPSQRQRRGGETHRRHGQQHENEI